MPLFSQRTGSKPLAKAIQDKALDIETRNALWNGLISYIFYDPKQNFGNFDYKQAPTVTRLWLNFFKQRLDQAPNYPTLIKILEDSFWKWERDYLFDFLEFTVKNHQDEEDVKKLTSYCNMIFIKESVPYRFIEYELTPITNETERNEISDALNSPFAPINTHFKKALSFMSDRKKPDYPNSIKESISAVECICQIIVGNRNTDLSKALKRLQDAKVEINPVLLKGFRYLYGWTNSEDGIRHAMMDLPNVDQDDARYMLVTCSAFVNYLITESNKAKINLKTNYRKLTK